MISIAVLTKKGSREMNEDSLAYKQQGEEALLALAKEVIAVGRLYGYPKQPLQRRCAALHRTEKKERMLFKLFRKRKTQSCKSKIRCMR